MALYSIKNRSMLESGHNKSLGNTNNEGRLLAEVRDSYILAQSTCVAQSATSSFKPDCCLSEIRLITFRI